MPIPLRSVSRGLALAASVLAAGLVQGGDAPAPAHDLTPNTAVAAVPTSGTLTLSQSLASADHLNETSEVARARLEQALATRRQALSLLGPQLTASGQLMKFTVANSPFGGVNRKLTGDVDGLGVNLNLTLFNASAVDAVRSQEAGVAAQTLDSTELRRALAYQVTGGFLLVIAAEHQVVAAIRARDVAAQTLEQTRARFKVGVATSNDATRSELTLATSELAVTQDRQAVAAARFSLGDLVGRDVVESLAEPEPATVPNRELGTMEQLGWEERADLASSELRIRATELLARAASNTNLPTIGVRGSYLLNSQQPAIPQPNSPEWQLAVVATWILYDGGNRDATVDLYSAQRRETVANLNLAKRQLHRDLATALSALQTAETSFVQSTTALKVARLNEQEILTRFKQGLATALDAADASAQSFQADSDLTSRQLDLASSRFTLRQLIGRWPLTDKAPQSHIHEESH